MELTDASPVIASGTGVAALAIVAARALPTWRTWRRVAQTRAAAAALLEVHQARIEEAIDEAGRRTGALADRGEALAGTLATLRQDAAHLRWLLGRVPAERASLARQLLELVLPTRERESGGDRAAARPDA